ncbi:hypothetical protein V5O48_008452 [Marasmius crinis-equi]|uniref:Cytochrome c oxidase subunit 8, mitochondrial n=1 Tax=Marasmius crinis-equi TaxID=585013 RepID=A0ABR3FE04_9AGAR
MSLVSRSGLRFAQHGLRTAGRRGIKSTTRPIGPGAAHTTVVTDHLPFSYAKKTAFGASLFAFATAALGLPSAAIYLRWHKAGGLKA